MDKHPLIKVMWRGRETIEAVPSLFDRTDQIEINLPPGYNHSLFCLFHPDAPPSQLENIKVSGAPQLLEPMARIKGLEEFAALVEPLTHAGVTVQVLSPPKVVLSRRGVKVNKIRTKQAADDLTGL